MNHAFIEREVALKRCRKHACRRSGHCGNAGSDVPCYKTHQPIEEFHYALAEKIRRIFVEEGGDPAVFDEPSPPEYSLADERKLAQFKRMLEEREAELAAEKAS
jgi:hypothetical protein